MEKDIWDKDLNDFLGQKSKTERKKVTESIKKEVMFRQDYKCFNCGKKLPPSRHFHHKKPVSKGGKNTLSNIIILCPDCHGEHHHKQRVQTASKKAKGSGKKKDIWDLELDDLI